jgi:hypothetical protein
MKDRERDIVAKAVNKLERGTGFRTTLHFYEHPDKPDAILGIQNDDYKVEFNVEIKLFLNKARLGLVVNQRRGMKGIPLLITEYVNPELMKTIENHGVNFIDAAGNALIKVPPLFIKIKGNRLDEENKIKAPQKTFNAAALQIIFTILCNPGIEKKPIREVAEHAGAAVVTVHRTIKRLERQGYLINRGTLGNNLVNKEDLIKEWVALYPENLKPNYLIGRYETKEDVIEDLNLQDYGALWGGEEAAARLTNYLRPFIYTIYIGDRQGEFILRNRLKKDPNGKLILMKKFWRFENFEYPGITHPILVYADLLATGDPRNIETAKIIYEKEIVRYIKQD